MHATPRWPPTRRGCSSPAALARYDALRVPRATSIHAASAANKARFHLPDGSAQRARDAQMAAGATDWSYGAVAWIYGHDAGAIEAVA